MKIYKITEASKYLGISINSLKTLANNGKLNSFKTSGEHRRFREDDLDAYMGVKKEKQERLTVMKEKIIRKIGRVRNDGRWHSRGSDWSTPQDLYDKLDTEFHFTLDVCASDWNAKCERYFVEEIKDFSKLSSSKAYGENGLVLDWGKNVCWMNPPYGKVLNDWMKKAYEESQKGAVVVCLVPSATDTAWWHDYAMKGEIRYLRGRPRFQTKEGTWQQTFSPSVIVVFKPSCDCGETSECNKCAKESLPEKSGN